MSPYSALLQGPGFPGTVDNCRSYQINAAIREPREGPLGAGTANVVKLAGDQVNYQGYKASLLRRYVSR